MKAEDLILVGDTWDEAEGVLDTAEKIRELVDRFCADSEQVFDEYDRARRVAWELAASSFVD